MPLSDDIIRVLGMGYIVGMMLWAFSQGLFGLFFRDDLHFLASHGRGGWYAGVDMAY